MNIASLVASLFLCTDVSVRYASKILKGSGVVKSSLNSHLCMRDYSKISTKYPTVFFHNSKLSQMSGIHSWSMKFMSKSKPKVVFTSDPRGERKLTNPFAEIVAETNQKSEGATANIQKVIPTRQKASTQSKSHSNAYLE